MLKDCCLSAKGLVRILAAWILIFSLTGCGPEAVSKVSKPPKDLIGQEQMSAILMDIHLIEGARLGEKMLGDSLSALGHYEQVWQKYGIDEERYHTSFDYYSRHPEIMDLIYQEAIEQLNRQSVDYRENRER